MDIPDQLQRNERERDAAQAVQVAEELLFGAPAVVIPSSAFLEIWSTAEKAKVAYCRATRTHPADVAVEGPDGGPYLISYVGGHDR